MSKPKVAVVKKDTVREGVKEALKLLGGMENFVKKGDIVALKPNVMAIMGQPAITDINVIAAVADLCFKAGAKEVRVIESPVCGMFAKHIFNAVGYIEPLEDIGVKLYYPEENDWVYLPVPKGVCLQNISIPRPLAEADVFITLPKAKTHEVTQVTLSIKNSHGILPDVDKAKHHRLRKTPEGISSLYEKFADILAAKSPDLCVMDMFYAMEGQGPAFGELVEMGTIIAGANAVSVDSVCEYIMGFDPMEVELTRISHERGLGVADLSQIEVIGEDINKLRRPFKRAISLPDTEKPQEMEMLRGDSCLGCHMPLRYIIDICNHFMVKDLKESPPFAIQVGVNPPEPTVSNYVLCFGDCAIYSSEKLKHKYRNTNNFVDVSGCPPLGLEWAHSFSKLVGKYSPTAQLLANVLDYQETPASKLPRDFNPHRWWWDSQFALEYREEINKHKK